MIGPLPPAPLPNHTLSSLLQNRPFLPACACDLLVLTLFSSLLPACLYFDAPLMGYENY